MTRTHIRRLTATLASIAALALAGAPAAAVSPTVETWTNHVEGPFVDCPDFATIGIWDIGHKLTYFYDSDGVAIRDIEQVDFTGRIVNAETGVWVPDSGSRRFFDTLAPDGSYLTTYMTSVRKSRYIHEGARIDFQTGELHGHAGFTPENIAALCEALGE